MALAVLPATDLLAQSLINKYYASVAPGSIPVGEDVANSTVVMAAFRFNSSVAAISITQLNLQLTNTTAGFDESRITDIRVYFENNGGEPGVYGDGTENLVSTSPHTFSGGTASIALSGVSTDSNGFDNLYVVIDLEDDTGFVGASPETTETIGVEITSVVHSGTGSPLAITAHGQQGKIDDYLVTATAAGLATGGPPPPEYSQGDSDVPVLQLFFDASDTDFGGSAPAGAHIDSITFTLAGTGDAGDISPGGVLLYEDTDNSTTFNPPTDILVGSGSASGTTALVDPVANLDIDSTGGRYFVALTLAGDATVGETIGLRIANPSTDIQFVDTITTDIGVSPQYQQLGYMTQTSLAVTDNVVTIIPAPDTDPPTIVATMPPNGGTLDGLDSPVVIYFNEDVKGADPAIPTDTYTFEDIDGAPVAFEVTYYNTGGEYKVLLQPAAPLDYETFYTVTVDNSDISDVYDNVMLGPDKEITFGTGLEFPVVTEPTVVRNRIVTGRADESEMVILIPTPAGGPSAKVTVQVFTATGRLVRTFVKSVPYSTITDGRIRWDGTNDGGKDLGPGVYFVQVRTAEYKRALKVMIVR